MNWVCLSCHLSQQRSLCNERLLSRESISPQDASCCIKFVSCTSRMFCVLRAPGGSSVWEAFFAPSWFLLQNCRTLFGLNLLSIFPLAQRATLRLLLSVAGPSGPPLLRPHQVCRPPSRWMVLFFLIEIDGILAEAFLATIFCPLSAEHSPGLKIHGCPDVLLEWRGIKFGRGGERGAFGTEAIFWPKIWCLWKHGKGWRGGWQSR